MDERGREGGEEREMREEENDVEKGEVGLQPQLRKSVVDEGNFHASRLQTLNPTNPLRIVLNANTRVASPSPAHQSHPPPVASQPQTQPRSVTTSRVSLLLLEFAFGANL